ncbi:hypothetical protein BCY91_08085 [Pelobium manganitolerans]|uniref:Peptidase S8 n=1 Tax=Pelobium manganitolerans TaxID=1842495 RepID=A0A419S432_9SPHI|nr:S8 family serine peptidase [Pelobium manganitolerans]RKD14424.1 hypothetical protein BCY91_08085 [Pelobium manganitolerans]
MQKSFIVGLLTASFLFAGIAQAQQILVNQQQSTKLQALKTDFDYSHKVNREKAFAMAKEKGWSVFRIQPNGTIVSLQGVDDLGFPIYLKTYNNSTAAATTKTNSLYNGGSLGLNLNGSSNSLIGKVGMWDGGLILTSHQEFAPNRIEQKDNPTALSSHATHVAGTLIAKGIYPEARGMAWGLQKLYAWDFTNDASEMTQAATGGMLISNHSYGYIAGWDYNFDANPPRWEYYGVPGSNEDYKFGFYDGSARDWDQICYNAPYYLPVVSAGNSRNMNGPAVGEEYYGYESASSSKFVSKGKRPAGISSNDGYDIIATTATAKNILTVGAVYGLPYGANSASDIQISSFSSWGPTDDGRVKPDLVGDGVSITSTGSDNFKSYTTLSGTSMASPNVSGSLVLLQEYYAQLNGGNFMRSASLKALAINTTDEAGPAIGPDYIYGWGLLNTESAATLIKNNGTKSLISERSLAQDETYTLQITTSGFGPLRATICWTDPQGTANTDGTINNRTPKLVNDLDLRLTKGTTTYFPYKLDPTKPANPASTADNIVDNVEQIYVADATPGQVYTLKVSHKGTLSKGPQKYSLVVSGIGGNTYCSSAPNLSDGAIISKVQIGSFVNNIPLSCRTYSDFTNLMLDLEKGKSYPFSLDLASCGGNATKIANIYIDWNNDGDFDDTNELVAQSAVYSANATFSGNINVPQDVNLGNYSLMRIVLNETSNANAVTPCGTYTKGETQDYKVHFAKPSLDAGISAFSTSFENLCAESEKRFTVKIKNFGSTAISNVPINLVLSSNSTIIKSVTETFTGVISPGAETEFTFSAGFDLQTNTAYVLDAKTELLGDQVVANNSISRSFNTVNPQNPDDLSATACDNASGYYQLNGTGDGTLFWYSSANASLPFQVGNHTFTDKKPVNNTFYVGLNDFKAKFGAADKKTYGGGQYSGNFGPKPIISVKAPMVLDSARLYISQSGQITFTVETTDGQILSAKTIDVTRTKTTADVEVAANLIADDPNDPGKMFKIGLEFPAAGTYHIGIEFNGATIFRSNSAVNNLPMALENDIIRLLGAYNPDNGTTITSSYYYFYNMLFKSLGCSNFTRSPVVLSKPNISQNGNILTTTTAFKYQWYLNNVAISGATQQSYEAKVSGLYKVEAISESGCTSMSDAFNHIFNAVETHDPAEIGLLIYPIPASENLNFKFELSKRENLEISLLNINGQIVFKQSYGKAIGKISDAIDVRRFASGNYVLSIKVANKVYSQKITIVH